MTDTPRLTRSETDRLLAGVCGGLADHFGIDATIVRVVFVLLAVFGGSGVVLYLALWLIVPRASNVDLPPRSVVRDGVDEGRRMAQDGAEAAKRGYQRVRGRGDAGQQPRPPEPGPPPELGPPPEPGQDSPDDADGPPRTG